MTRSRPQPDDVERGTLDVEDFAVDELTVGLRGKAREGYRPEDGVEIPDTHGARFHRSDSGVDRLPLTANANLPEPVWRDRPAAAPAPNCSPASASDNATLRIAPIHVEHDAGKSLGAFVNVLERSNATTVLDAVNDHVDTLQTHRLPNV